MGLSRLGDTACMYVCDILARSWIVTLNSMFSSRRFVFGVVVDFVS